MAYVDLNPIRAESADMPKQSDHTSIQLRIRTALKGEQPSNLLPFIRNDKRGYISENSTKILNGLNIPHDNWLKLTTDFGKLFHGPVGTQQALSNYCEHLEKRRRHFAASCQHFHNH